VKQAELLDALGAVDVDDSSAPGSPQAATGATAGVARQGRGSLPSVTQESVHLQIREHLSLTLSRESTLQSLELKGDLNLLITDPAFARVRLVLAEPESSRGVGATELQFKNHPNVAKYDAKETRLIALKDETRSFPVGQPLGVLKWRYAGRDESAVPLSINCWPTPGNDGTCEINIEYELENDALALHDVLISIPLPTGSYPTISSATGTHTLNVETHSLDWSIPIISAASDTNTGSLEFSIAGDDVGVFFPVKIGFVAERSLFGIGAESVKLVESEEDVKFSQEVTLWSENYVVV